MQFFRNLSQYTDGGIHAETSISKRVKSEFRNHCEGRDLIVRLSSGYCQRNEMLSKCLLFHEIGINYRDFKCISVT